MFDNEVDYEYDYSRVVSDSEEFYYDDDTFDYDDVEQAELNEWEQWHHKICSEMD